MGALVAGADEGTADALRRLSAALGLAYQIRDEIEDSAGDGPPSPLVVALAFECDAERARRLLQGMGADERRELIECVLDDAWALFDRYKSDCLRALQPLASQPLKGLLFRLVFLFLGPPAVAVGSARKALARGR